MSCGRKSYGAERPSIGLRGKAPGPTAACPAGTAATGEAAPGPHVPSKAPGEPRGHGPPRWGPFPAGRTLTKRAGGLATAPSKDSSGEPGGGAFPGARWGGPGAGRSEALASDLSASCGASRRKDGAARPPARPPRPPLQPPPAHGSGT